jgi:hypothetical protein
MSFFWFFSRRLAAGARPRAPSFNLAQLLQQGRRQLAVQPAPPAAAETCFRLVPDFSQPTYGECVVPTDGGAPTFQQISAREGAFEIRRLRLLAENQR